MALNKNLLANAKKLNLPKSNSLTRRLLAFHILGWLAGHTHWLAVSRTPEYQLDIISISISIICLLVNDIPQNSKHKPVVGELRVLPV